MVDVTKSRCCRTWYLAPLFLAICGSLLILVGVWAAYLRQTLTPVYTTVSCLAGKSSLQSIDLVSGNISFTIEVVCSNPNPYSIQVQQVQGGPVQIGAQKTQVGMLTDIGSTVLKAHGQGSVTSTISISMAQDPGNVLTEVVPLLLGPVPVYLQLNLLVNIEVDILLTDWKVSEPFNKDCGLYIVGVPGLLASPNAARMGPLGCVPQGGQLTIPAPDLSITQGSPMTFPPFHIAPHEVEKGNRMKDTCLGSLIGIGCGLGSLMLLGAAGWIWHQQRTRGCRTAETPSKAQMDEKVSEELSRSEESSNAGQVLMV